MGNLKFIDFTWPYNPTTFNVSNEKKIVEHEYPDIDGAEHEELGLKPRVYTGSGIFFGSSAYSDWIKLSNLFRSKKRGTLLHPKWGISNVIFTKLTAEEEPLSNYVSYSFEFVEDKAINIITKPISPKPGSGGGGGGNSKKYHVVKKGETLWDISKKYYGKSIYWKTIANANKNLIKDPNLIYPGWKLLIP